MQLTDFDNIVINESRRPEVLMIIENGQVNEVNLKKMLATAGLVGALFTAGNVSAYDNKDLMKMGFNPSEANQLAQMIDSDPQQAADIINNTIDNMRQIDGQGAKRVYGGDTLTFPKTDAASVGTTKPTNLGPMIGTRQDPQSSSYDGKPSGSKDPFGLSPEMNRGSGDPEKLKKNALILRDVLNADRSVAKHINRVYYSSQLNKIVIIPNYQDYGRQAGVKINSKLGQGVLDNIGRRMVTPIITRAIAKFGVPGLDMDNVVIVDRMSRAPR